MCIRDSFLPAPNGLGRVELRDGACPGQRPLPARARARSGTIAARGLAGPSSPTYAAITGR
eukprot:3465115-Alexandrium_andersonii.AAC.1